MMEPNHRANSNMLEIPSKRYFTIGEVAELCGLKTHVLRYWEQEFPQLNPVKRRGNRRYYQRDDVLLINTIQTLLYEEGFTINGARQKLEQETKAKQKPTKPPVALGAAMQAAIDQPQDANNDMPLTAEEIGADFDLGHLNVPRTAPPIKTIARHEVSELIDQLQDVLDLLAGSDK